MAAETAAARLRAMDFGGGGLPSPDGFVGGVDRAHLLELYVAAADRVRAPERMSGMPPPILRPGLLQRRRER